MGSIRIATAILIVLFSYGFPCKALEATNRITIEAKDTENNKRARDIISSFLNAWKTSKIIPDYAAHHADNNRHFSGKTRRNRDSFQLDKLDFIGQRKSQLDAPSLFALQNSFNPKPVEKAKTLPSQPMAEAFIGKESEEEMDDRSPELKLASLVSKPIYHMLPASKSSEEDIKQFMFGGNEELNENNLGLPNEGWEAKINSRRSFRHIPASEDRDDDEVDRYTENNEVKKNDINQGARYYGGYRNTLPLDTRRVLEELERRNVYNQIGDKKELITDPYDSLSLPVSEFLSRKDSDRKFYKSLPDNMIDEYEARPFPAQFKLQKNHLWGNIQKRWRRSKINNKGRLPLQEELNIRGVPRSLGIGLGETGNSYDAYGQIGQNVEQALMKLNGGKPACSQNQEMSIEQASTHESTPTMLMDGADIQQDDSRQTDNGIIKISPPQKRSRTYDSLRNPLLRARRSLLLLRKRALQDALSKKSRAQKALKLQQSNVASRSFSGHYAGGLPDSRPTETDEGIAEDNEHDMLDEKISHDSTPLLMKIAQHDRDDVNKLWNNKHSPGNGFYTGHGEGPNHPYLGDYFGHGPDEMLHDDGIKSLEESASPEDHHTANLIDSIWEHDLGEDHLGEHRIERHRGSQKIKNYFGGHHSSVMLPTETLDGIDTHWTGHLPHLHSSGYSHNDGHPIDFSPTRIKAIQAIQDDPLIDAELNPHDGIGTEIGHAHRYSHGYHHGDGHSFGGMNLAPFVNDQVHVEDSHEDEYKQHIDNLLTQYHGLEERLRGTAGTLAGHMDPATFGHHGSHHLHTGYDLYAYKNPWEGMKIPYHVPVSNHPLGQEEEPPPSPLTFEGKTDEKGAPVIEGGKEEGGKGGALVEDSTAMAGKGGKNKEGESPKGAKASGSKSPHPVIPKQRGGPEVSTGKNETEDSQKEEKGKEEREKEAKEADTKEEGKESKSSTEDNDLTKGNRKEKEQESSQEKQSDKDESKEKEAKVESDMKDNNEKDLKKMVDIMLNSTGKQSEMLNNLKTALGDEANNPKSLTALQLAKLKQLGSMQQALLSSLARQAKKKPKDQLPGDNEGAGMSEIKQLLELQSLQQLGAGIKANALVSNLRQTSLLQSLKSAQENILKNMKQSTNLLENNDKQENGGMTQSAEIQKFFGKLPIKLLGSDLGNVGSEKLSSRTHPILAPNNEGGGGSSIGELMHKLNTGHTKLQQKTTSEASIKPMLNTLLSESLLKTMKNKIKHMNRKTSNKESVESSTSDKVYSTIGNEGPTTADEETGHRRSTRDKKRNKQRHKKVNAVKKVVEDKEENSTAVEKAEIAPFHERDIDEDVVSKKDNVHQ